MWYLFIGVIFLCIFNIREGGTEDGANPFIMCGSMLLWPIYLVYLVWQANKVYSGKPKE